VLWAAGFSFVALSELVGRTEFPALDAAAGWALLCAGLVLSFDVGRRRDAWPLVAAGLAWSLGTLWAPAVFLHRGPLTQALLLFPGGRAASRIERSAVMAAYAYAVVYPLGANDAASLVFAVGVLALAAWRLLGSPRIERRARGVALAGGVLFSVAIAAGAGARLAGLGLDRPVLVAYDLAICAVSLVLAGESRWGRGRRTGSVVTRLVVDLGDAADAGTLRERLAEGLGDPTLVVAYWLADQSRYVDEVGRPIELAGVGDPRISTPIEEDGVRIAALVHDPAVLDDPALTAAVAAATRVAVSNVKLQAEVQARVAEVEASRRRIVDATDAERRRLEVELRQGAERRLERVATLLAGTAAPLAEVRGAVAAARRELRELASGIRPTALTEGGLAAALPELARGSPVPVRLDVPERRFAAALEAAAYFVCSEGLANVAKYAAASTVRVAVVCEGTVVRLSVEDDGVGGAVLSRGSGLSGLADRVEALGGRLHVESLPGRGTRLVAELPANAEEPLTGSREVPAPAVDSAC
jgi:Histidine kinase-, DNA gyrase B-, and HSP90-like ATPase